MSGQARSLHGTKIYFLGTGDSMGVPRVYCDCTVCQEARKGGENQRLRSTILIKEADGELLVDCGPDWKKQMERIGKRGIGDILVTHSHFDHIAGLPEVADACRWTENRSNVYAPSEVLETIKHQFPWISNHIDFHPIDSGFDFLGWTIAPFRVFHGKNGFSYAYRFHRDGLSWVYCPDSIALREREKAMMKDLRLLILGTSFYKEEAAFQTRSIYDMTEAEELIAELEPQEVWFTHMSHGVNILNNYQLRENIRLARDGKIYTF